jgi:riboflavin synthase
MFTGIVEAIGTVKTARCEAGGKVISVDLAELAEGLKVGDSIAVNGVCLTVSRLAGRFGEFDVSDETLATSAMDKVRAGMSVNLERAMSADGRFGGHIVLGHVDGVAKIKVVERKGDFAEIRFATEGDLLDEMVVKGAVCVDGVSLTIAKMDDSSFSVSVIPTTLKASTLGTSKAGDSVNVETDIITKTVKKQFEKMVQAKEPLTAERLKECGF